MEELPGGVWRRRPEHVSVELAAFAAAIAIGGRRRARKPAGRGPALGAPAPPLWTATAAEAAVAAA